MINYFRAVAHSDYEVARQLFKEYAEAINIDLGFQKFDRELAQIETMYQLPHGGIILAEEDGIFLGCVAIRRINETIGELKRMYVKPGNQQKGIGKNLLHQAIELAKNCDYGKIRLDTLSTMTAAIHLYTAAGFNEIPAYYLNPMPGALYFEKLLRKGS